MNADKQTDIESRLAHQERQIEELSDIVKEQAETIGLLKRALIEFESDLKNALDASKSDKKLSPSEIAARDKPPHY